MHYGTDGEVGRMSAGVGKPSPETGSLQNIYRESHSDVCLTGLEREAWNCVKLHQGLGEPR